MTKPLTYTLFNFDDHGDTKLNKLHTNLVKPPFRWVFLGSTMCGKTTYIHNVIFKWYIDYFDRVYIYCGSDDDIDNYKKLAKKYKMSKRVWISKEVDLEELEELYDELEEKNKKKPIRSLVVFDDQAFNNVCSLAKKKNIVDKILMAGRHINMSLIMSSQQYTALNKNIRSINASAITVFGCNDDELELISKEHSNHLTQKACYELMKKQTKKKYSNITIDRNRDIGDKFRDSFLNKIGGVEDSSDEEDSD